MSDPMEDLLKYFNRPLSAPKSLDVAKFILLNASTDLPLGPGTLNNKGNNPSLMGRIFDILSRPNYAVAEGIRSMSPRGVIEGLTGRKKTTFSDVLKDLGVKDPAIRATAGFALDVGLDPTTYIPGGAISQGVRKTSTALGITPKFSGVFKPGEVVVRDKNLAQNILDKGEPVFPEVFGLPKSNSTQIPDFFKRPSQSVDFNFDRDILREHSPVNPKTLPKATDIIPGQLELPLEGIPKNPPSKLTDDIDLPVDQSTSSTKGQIPFKFPDFSITDARKSAIIDRAEDLVDKAVKGDPEAIFKVLPHPKNISIGAREQRAAAELLASWDNSKATANINKKYPETINARQQVKLYYRAIQKAKQRFKNPSHPANKTRIASDAYKIYTAVERTLEAKGFVPRIGTGENVRLSDVIEQVGGHRNAQQVLDEFATEIKEGSSTWQAVEALRAAGSINEAKSVESIVESIETAHTATKSSDRVSDGFMDQFDRIIKKLGTANARAEGISPAGIEATEKLIDYALNTGKSPAQIIIEQKSKILDDIVAKGKCSPEMNEAITRALEADLGKIPKWVGSDNKAVEFFMGRVATWWGQTDLRPLSLNAIGSSQATAAARGHALDKLFDGFNQNQRFEALRLAQGVGTASTPETQQLATQILKLMDNLVGQVSGQSVVLRSGVHLEMLNKWMKYYKTGFEFTRGTAKNIAGENIDYSKGTDWLNSWKTAKITEDPKIFIFKAQQAMEQATREKALFDEIGERFGAKAYGKGFKVKIDGYPYLEGYYFPEDIARQIPRVVKDWSIPRGASQNSVLKLYDRILSMWKTGVTIYRPAHHIRNMIGDVYLGWMDGVNSVRPYMLAARVQKSMRGAYDTIEDVDKLVQLGILGKGFKTPNSNEVIFKNKSGVEFTAEQIGAVAHQKGLLEHARTLEDIIDMGEQQKFKPFGGRVQKIARGASELQNHNARLAHFIDKIIKSRGNNLEEIFEQASRRARKWHPSGIDLTPFEKNVLRRIIPFYSWMRKSLPLLIEGLVMNPGKTVIPSKLYGAIQEYQGIETPGRSDPFPVDQMFPEWIRSQGVGPISGSTGFLGEVSDQMPPGYIMGGMGLNPLTELVTQIESPGRTLSGSLTPAVKIPFELMTGTKTFTGEPILGVDARPGAMGQYVGEQIPIYSALQGILGVTPFGSETKRASRSNNAGTEAFINWLTGAGIKGTGPYIRQGQYERTAPIKAQQKVNKDEFLKYLREQLGS